jgi:hypothetical protein
MSIDIKRAQRDLVARQLGVIDCIPLQPTEKSIERFLSLSPRLGIGAENTARTNGDSLRDVLLAA